MGWDSKLGGLDTDSMLLTTKSVCVCVHAKSLQSCPTLCDPMATVAHQAPLSVGFSRQKYWSGLPCPPPGDLPNPRTEPPSLMSPALAGGFSLLAPPGKP